MAYVQHRPGLEIALRSDIIQDRDVQILTASFPGHPTTTIINMYNNKDRKNDRASKIIRQLPLALDQLTIITGDWNMHHLLWANQDRVQHDQETTEMVEWLTQHGFRLINTPGEATYLGHIRNRSLSVLDLIFANGPATQNACPSDWAVNQDIAYGSDHYAI